jgi:hypothetical protein
MNLRAKRSQRVLPLRGDFWVCDESFVDRPLLMKMLLEM